jgi:hypothetical protein
MKPRAYVDTSSYLAILLGEKEAAGARKRLAGHILCSSTLLLVEAERNLVRLAREHLLSVEQFQQAMDQLRTDRELFILRDFTIDLTLTGKFPLVRIPRSLDLIHLRTACWFAGEEEGLQRFETLDDAQAAAALEMGLPVHA